MKKSDLKTGYKVKTKNGINWVVIKDVETMMYGHQSLLLAKEGGFEIGDLYNDDLTFARNDEYSIVEVFENRNSSSILNPKEKGKLLFKRETPKEMTVEEIEKELGYKIKIIE
jgi:translation initiation factor 2 beta subunit (eIF-2beta)/eIF-5